MKILKIFGVVVGIHVFALMLIFANPGCSSTTRPAPQPADTVAAQPSPSVTLPNLGAGGGAPAIDPGPAITPATGGFNPDAPATYAGSSVSSGVHFSPTRPNTPAAQAVLTQPVENVTPATTYVVKPGDSLWSLQKRFHVNLKEIAAANNLRISAPLHEGQKLIIPKGGSSSSTAGKSTAAAPAATAHSTAKTESPSTRPSGEEFKYTVKPGDTLGTIARKFDVKTRELALHNNITDPRNLRAGTEISIPGWKGTANTKARREAAQPAAAPEPAAPAQTTPTPTETNSVPNLLEPVPAQPSDQAAPAPAPAGNVPVINLDENNSTSSTSP